MYYNYGMKRMSDFSYHRGIKLCLYPSFRQISLIKRNSGCARFIYNRLLAIEQEIYDLKKCRIYRMILHIVFLSFLQEYHA